MNKRDDEEARAEGSARAEMLAQLQQTARIKIRERLAASPFHLSMTREDERA